MNDDWVDNSQSYEEQQGYAAGRRMATSLLALFLPNPHVNMRSVTNVARKFANWDGYKGGDGAISYATGFMDAFQFAQTKQIGEAKDE